MPQTQRIEQLKQSQKAALLLPDKKKGRAEYDRLAEAITTAQYEQAVEVARRGAEADEAQKQTDRDHRQANKNKIDAAESVIENARKRAGRIFDLGRQLATEIAEQRAAFTGLNVTLGGIDGKEDYGRFGTDFDNGLFAFLEHHGIPRGGMAQREEPTLQLMTDALNRAAARIAFVKAQAKLPPPA